MIKDPISEGGGGDSQINQFRTNFESIAVGNTETDIPTLVSYLKSEEVLYETSQLFNISYEKLEKKCQDNYSARKSCNKTASRNHKS